MKRCQGCGYETESKSGWCEICNEFLKGPMTNPSLYGTNVAVLKAIVKTFKAIDVRLEAIEQLFRRKKNGGKKNKSE